MSESSLTPTPTPDRASAKLLQPIKVGNLQLQHRVVLAPLTRYRANKHHVHGDLGIEYYTQRSKVPGTLLITEATFISPEAGGFDNAPGLWSDAQVAGWRKITDAVHANGSFIFTQLWALGRAAKAEVLRREPEGPFDVVSAGNIGIADHARPRPLTVEEIATYEKKYVIAAKNAIAAGFDGVEIHNGNGYLLDQFLQDVSNNRTDEYGGSIENRARFPLKVLDVVTEAIGEERTAIRISPWGQFQEMRMENPLPQFSYYIEQVKARHPNLAYLHVIESRVAGSLDDEDADIGGTTQPSTNAADHDDMGRPITNSNEFVRKAWQPRPYISAGGYSEEDGVDLALRAGEYDVMVAFGRSFIANPDLPTRIRKNIQLAEAEYDSFYAHEQAAGYIDYPFADEDADPDEPAPAVENGPSDETEPPDEETPSEAEVEEQVNPVDEEGTPAPVDHHHTR